jgi:dCMP deaminase
MKRPSWDEYFLDLAESAAARSTCARLSVGTVLVHDKQVICTGMNGGLPGRPHCVDRPGISAPGCCGCNHSEANAVALAAKRGVSLKGCTAYVTVSPCEACAKLLVMAGVVRVAYRREYRVTDHLNEMVAYGLRVERVDQRTE